jgi:hypothetical protein
MRCPDCNKFVSYDESNPEVEGDPEVTEDGDVTVSVRVVLPCAECGQELKDCTLELTGSISEGGTPSAPPKFEGKKAVREAALVEWRAKRAEYLKTLKPFDPEKHKGEGHELSAEADSASFTSRSEGSGRYCVTFYGASVPVTVSCSCGETWELELSGDERASGFEELV